MFDTRRPCPPTVSSSSRKRAGGSSIVSRSAGASFGVQAMSGAWVGLYRPVRVRWRMAFRNSVRSATLDALLPELAEGFLRQRRKVAGVRPAAHRAGQGPDGAFSQERLLCRAARLGGDLIQ